MVDSVIVTIIDHRGQEQFDVELPCNIMISDLKKQLIDISELSHGKKDIQLCVNGRELDDGTSLAENNVWDGSFLTIKVGV